MAIKQSPLLVHIEELERRTQNKEVTLAEIIEIFGIDGHFIFILFLILPFLQPIPLFGLSTPFGIIIALIALLYYLNQPPFIPQRWQNKSINKEILLKIADASEYFFKKLGHFFKPRWEFLFLNPFRSLNMGIIAFNAILLALPLPIPFSNALPAWAIFFQTLAYLEKDGLLIVISYLQALLSLIFFILLGLSALSGLNYLGTVLN